jgi:hypothetical protein
MLLIAIAAATAAAQPSLPAGPSAIQQARATVRIISGARVTAEKLPLEAIVRNTQVSSADGSQGTARLVEFP